MLTGLLCPDGLRRTQLLLLVILGSTVAAGGGLAAGGALPVPWGTVVVLGLALPAAGVGTLRFPWLPVVLYWSFQAFLSSFSLDLRMDVVGVPVSLTDVAAGLLVPSWLVLRQRGERQRAPQWTTVGMWLIAGYAGVAALNGLLHGYLTYSVAIDVRNAAYLLIGFMVGLELMRRQDATRVIQAVLLISVVGFCVQQGVATTLAVHATQQSSLPIDVFRDISVSYFVGKYGLLQAAALFHRRGIRKGYWAALLLSAGLVATTVTLVRTAWLTAVVALAAFFALRGRRTRARAAAVAVLAALVLVATFQFASTSALISGISDRLNIGSQLADPAADTIASRLAESQQALSSLQTPVDWAIGVGLGLPGADGVHTNQHNSYIWLLSKEGILGTLLFVCVVLALPIAQGIRRLRSPTGVEPHLLLLSVLVAAQVANVVSGLTAGHLTYWEYQPIIGMTVAWIAVLSKRSAASVIRPSDTSS